MSHPYSHVRPDTHLFMRLPSDLLKLIEIKANTIIEVGKLGSFPSNLLLGRPYYHTYELLEKQKDEAWSRLRVVPPSELNADIVAEDGTPSEDKSEPATPLPGGSTEDVDVLATHGIFTEKNNRLTVDDASRQALSQQEIEELKKSSGGKEVIEKLLANHAGLDEKTAFSRAKYMVRKTRKYLKRFTVLPMELGTLISYISEKEPQRIMEMREEPLGLLTAWSNAHVTGPDSLETSADGTRVGGGRWLVVDDAGGLVVAAMAERMGILHSIAREDDLADGDPPFKTQVQGDANETADEESTSAIPNGSSAQLKDNGVVKSAERQHTDFPPPATTDTITVLHPAVQPNISMLKYFGYDSNIPDATHPLHTHLKSLSWLQLLHPSEDPTYCEPELVPDAELQKWKSGKRGTYWRKRRRWARCQSIVDETREGGFDGLVIASNMDPATILPHTVSLVRGGGHIVIYSPTIEPLVQLMDLYSRERRAAYIQHLAKSETPDPVDFPVDPRLLLAPTLQTSRVRQWQVLPGRTHPMMTSKGGAEGFVFTARKVIPLEGVVEARGNHVGKRRKVDGAGGGQTAGRKKVNGQDETVTK